MYDISVNVLFLISSNIDPRIFFSYLRVDIELVHETKVQPLVAAVGGRIEILLLFL